MPKIVIAKKRCLVIVEPPEKHAGCSKFQPVGGTAQSPSSKGLKAEWFFVDLDQRMSASGHFRRVNEGCELVDVRFVLKAAKPVLDGRVALGEIIHD